MRSSLSPLILLLLFFSLGLLSNCLVKAQTPKPKESEEVDVPQSSSAPPNGREMVPLPKTDVRTQATNPDDQTEAPLVESEQTVPTVAQTVTPAQDVVLTGAMKEESKPVVDETTASAAEAQSTPPAATPVMIADPGKFRFSFACYKLKRGYLKRERTNFLTASKH